MAQNSPLPCVNLLISATMHIDRLRGGRKRFVEVTLDDIGFETVDCFQSGSSVQRECVGAYADGRTVVLVAIIEKEMAVSKVGVVRQVKIGYTGEERARVACEWMKGEAIYYDKEDL